MMKRLQCPRTTRKGKPCGIPGEATRDGYCHVHDPQGKYRQQLLANHIDFSAKLRTWEKRGMRCEFVDGETGKRCCNKRLRGSKNKYCRAHKGYLAKIREETARNRHDYIYLFYLGFDELYKIGKTKEWEKRLSALRIANPRLKKMKVIRVVNMGAVEKAIHKRMREHKVEREIFRLTDEMVDALFHMMDEYAI